MISKIYIDFSERGKGYGFFLLDFIKQKCLKKDIRTIWLTVNKENSKTISWYKKNGFSIKEAVKKSIGNGFYMDDFIMEMTIS